MDGMVIIGQWSSKSTFGTSDWQAYRFVRKRLPQLLPLREGDSWWWWPGRWRRRVCLLQRWVMYARTSRPYVRHHVSLPPRWHSLIIIIDTNTQPSSQSQSFSNFYFLLLSTFKEVRINRYKQTEATLWSKDCNIIKRVIQLTSFYLKNIQLTSFDPKNVTSRTGGSN